MSARDRRLRTIIELAHEIARGNYDLSEKLFDLTRPDSDSTDSPNDIVAELAESFGMMMVKVEAREYELELMIEDLRKKNEALAIALRKIEILENIKKHLGKFVPESVKTLIEKAPDSPDLEKHEQDVTILFLDIAGYTKLCEKMNGDEVGYILEKYFSSFLDDIYHNQGDINETAGDGLMIIFQHQDKKQHALNAVKTAITIQEKVRKTNQALDRFPMVTMNIGINSGLAMVGSSQFSGILGDRWTFTATGPVTNVAARIGAQAVDGQILIGEETATRVADGFPLIDLGTRNLKNVAEPVRIFHVRDA